MGRTDESLAESKWALGRGPADPILNVHLGWNYLYARQYDRAIEQLRKTLEFDPNIAQAHQFLGEAYEQKGMYPEAIAEFQKAQQLFSTPRTLAFLGHTYALLGEKDKAFQEFGKLLELSKRRYVSPYFMAIIYAGLGDTEQALNWLQKAFDDHSESLMYMNVEATLDRLRSHPRFQDLARRMGLPLAANHAKRFRIQRFVVKGRRLGFGAGSADYRNPLHFTGPNALDRTHQISFGGIFDLPKSPQLSFIGHFFSPLSQTLTLP